MMTPRTPKQATGESVETQQCRLQQRPEQTLSDGMELDELVGADAKLAVGHEDHPAAGAVQHVCKATERAEAAQYTRGGHAWVAGP